MRRRSKSQRNCRLTPIVACTCRTCRPRPTPTPTYTGIGEFQATVGGLIETVLNLSKAVEAEKLNVSPPRGTLGGDALLRTRSPPTGLLGRVWNSRSRGAPCARYCQIAPAWDRSASGTACG